MEEDFGLDKRRIWGLEKIYGPGRAIQIYEAIKDLDIKTAVDIACGVGLVAETLHWVVGEWEQFDIKSYPEWEHLEVKPTVQDVREFIKTDKKYDLVLFLNSYRNWEGEDKNNFDKWVKTHAKYFITSGVGEGEKIGKDIKNYILKLIRQNENS